MSEYTVVLRYQCEKCKAWQDEVGIVASLAIIDIPTYSKNACKNCGHGKLHIVTAIDISDYATEQAEEIATLKAALDASNAALAEARKLIRDIASRDLDISEGYRHVSYNAIVIEAKKQVASWDSAAVAATTQDAPQQEVTLTDIEIEWLAKHVSKANENRYYSREAAENNWRKPPSQVNRVVVLSPTGITYALAPKYDTPANRAAIEARRNKEGE